jgi:hypothetical protein
MGSGGVVPFDGHAEIWQNLGVPRVLRDFWFGYVALVHYSRTFPNSVARQLEGPADNQKSQQVQLGG